MCHDLVDIVLTIMAILQHVSCDSHMISCFWLMPDGRNYASNWRSWRFSKKYWSILRSCWFRGGERRKWWCHRDNSQSRCWDWITWRNRYLINTYSCWRLSVYCSYKLKFILNLCFFRRRYWTWWGGERVQWRIISGELPRFAGNLIGCKRDVMCSIDFIAYPYM